MLNVIWQSFKMSLQNIKTNKMRSFLTMLGIMIGVAAVIALMTIVTMVIDNVMGQFEGLGANELTVSVPGTVLQSGITDEDLDELREVEGVDGIAPTVSMATAAVYDGEVYDTISVQGTDTSYFLHNDDLIAEGRYFNEGESNGYTNVCVVDQNFVETVLQNKGGVGTTVRLNGFQYKIIGIQAEDDSLLSSYTDNSDLDGSVIIPYRNALNMSQMAHVESFTVYVADGYDTSDVEDNLREVLDEIYNEVEDSYTIINLESLQDVMDTIETMLNTMLGGIAGISLLVGGIGIMNMMLVSVSERTKEIGLRKALGAEPIRIQVQFLIESICLSIMGGIIGVILGVVIAVIAGIALGVDFVMSWSSVAIGLGFSAAVGVIFGWAPARRASRLNPIDALRSE